MRRLLFRRTTRQKWDAHNRTRVVIVVAIAEPDGSTTGEVWADVAGVATKVQSHPQAMVDAKKRVVWVDEATAWIGPAPGCSCKIPNSLRGFDPIAAGA